jgi:hypothetical protein
MSIEFVRGAVAKSHYEATKPRKELSFLCCGRDHSASAPMERSYNLAGLSRDENIIASARGRRRLR